MALSPPLKDSLSALYERLWKPGAPPPDLSEVFGQHPNASLEERFAAILADQRLRWRAGVPIPAEKYFELWPELTRVPAHQIELVAAEFHLRLQRGETLSRDEISQRFPTIANAVTQRLSELSKSRVGKTGESLNVPVSSGPAKKSGTISIDASTQVRTPSTNRFSALDTDDSPMLGQMVGNRYVLTRRLGAGGFGQVYLAQDQRFASHEGGRVAVKLMEQGSEFRKEALLMRQFKHPNVAEVYDYGVEPTGLAWMVMEFLPGETLDKWAREFRTPVPLERLVPFVEQISDALDSAHARNLVHHDLKPGNIMVLRPGTPNEQFKLLDFGLASKLDSQDSLVNHTRQRAFTPYYVAPETIAGEELTPRSDIYTFGVILYELLTGHMPWPRIANLYVQVDAVGNKPPRPFSEVAPGRKFPAGLEDLVMKCLNKKAADRPQRMNEVRDEFRRIVRPPAPPMAKGTGVGRWVLAGVVVLSVVGTFAVDRWFGNRSQVGPVVSPEPLPPGFTPAKDSKIRTIGVRQFHSIVERRLSPQVTVRFLLIPQERGLPFYMQETKVTRRMFAEYFRSPGVPPEVRQRFDRSKLAGDFPVYGMTVKDAHLFARWLGGDLPTALQWDTAAGGNADGRTGPFNPEWDHNADGKQIAVGGKPRPAGEATHDVSGTGVKDMAGNGREFTRDLTNEDASPVRDLTTERDDVYVTLRGASYRSDVPYTFGTQPQSEPVVRKEPLDDIGFRVVVEIP